MATLSKLFVPSNEYISINAARSIPIGTAISIQNQGNEPLLIHTGLAKPAVDTTAYAILPDNLAVWANISADSEEVWVRGLADATSIHVEVISGGAA